MKYLVFLCWSATFGFSALHPLDIINRPLLQNDVDTGPFVDSGAIEAFIRSQVLHNTLANSVVHIKLTLVDSFDHSLFLFAQVDCAFDSCPDPIVSIPIFYDTRLKTVQHYLVIPSIEVEDVTAFSNNYGSWILCYASSVGYHEYYHLGGKAYKSERLDELDSLLFDTWDEDQLQFETKNTYTDTRKTHSMQLVNEW